MKFTELLQRTLKSSPDKEDLSKNAVLLTKAGYVNCLMSGVYSFLPLGLRVLRKIENIVREEMDKLGGQEILMPALTPKTIWETTGRYDAIDVLFKLKGCNNKDLVLAATHEEVATPLAGTFVNSYKDLPLYTYQIQTKFRNELRAKSGILRGREFRMKDLYSFHTSQEDLDNFYEKVIVAYKNIFAKCGIGDRTILTYASGGAFSKYSHEFQAITNAGEDIVYKVGDIGINDEIIDDENVLKEFNIKNKNDLETVKTVEIGNIFKLGTKFTAPCGMKYTDKDGNLQTPVMGCYGIGTTRLMGTVVECLADEKGLVWPEAISPFKYHLVCLTNKEDEIQQCNEIYNTLIAKGIDVLYDNRKASNGEKLNDADLMGITNRLVVSGRTLKEGKIELKKRNESDAKLITIEEIK